MNLVNSFLIAFAMYSRIPVPSLEWTKDRMRYVMCFFPFVGLAAGGLLWLWLKGTAFLGFQPAAAGLIGTAVPLLVSGGIHMDGFIDTADALSSYGDREKKLEIMKDPHTGAFGVLSCGLYLLCYAGLMTELAAQWGQGKNLGGILMALFFLERAFSGLSVAAFPCAKKTGLAATFADSAQKRTVRRVLLIEIGAAGAALWILGGFLGLWAAAGQAAVFFWYYRLSQKKFGGITGDLAGFFLQICEAVSIGTIVLGMKVMR